MMLALSLGVFALSYSATWSNSQLDQAAYQAGADVRAAVARGVSTTPVLPADYAALPGVQNALPVERIAGAISLAKGNVDLLALDAGSAASVVDFRADEADQPLDQLMGTLHDGRPDAADRDAAGRRRLLPGRCPGRHRLDRRVPVRTSTWDSPRSPRRSIQHADRRRRRCHGHSPRCSRLIYRRVASVPVTGTRPRSSCRLPCPPAELAERGPTRRSARARSALKSTSRCPMNADHERRSWAPAAWRRERRRTARGPPSRQPIGQPPDGIRTRPAGATWIPNVAGMAVQIDGSGELSWTAAHQPDGSRFIAPDISIARRRRYRSSPTRLAGRRRDRPANHRRDLDGVSRQSPSPESSTHFRQRTRRNRCCRGPAHAGPSSPRGDEHRPRTSTSGG